ncbi:hypothetical protein [Senegalia massiliensis]|uniref:Uncharacterized protein n=1 Tax=Senegalia massiliensis TaxID=1720316 RepID=A0A845R0P5_9CLOT|nr:hypothetical protein [Senegalia massiliensis]NBI07814.1 hypothetical protein [Senegalia massiliensis]
MSFKDIKLNYDIMAKNNIPLLVNSFEWKKMFGNLDNNDIQNAKKELLEHLRNQRKYKSDLKKLQNKKRDIMVDIVNLSHKVNNNDKNSISKLELSRSEMLEINKEIENLEIELDNMPSKIRHSNFELLNITIKIAYQDLKIKEKKLVPIYNEIEELRIKLKELIENKNDYEEEINNAYTFLHNMIGKEEIEKLDQNFLEKN